MISTPRSIGNYVLEHELGRGGTGQVWRGRHRFLHEREVAVKILLSQDEESIARFTREADLTSRLRHPNIIAVYDHGTAGSFLYTIMELAPGGSLRQYMEQVERIPLKDAVSIFRQIGAALDFAHSQNIIHRDISPGNILLEEGTSGKVLLTDFGIARLPEQSHTTAQVIMGTPGFFSPEHAESATSVTALSDLYGLGVVLYYMVTGTWPWEKLPEHPTYQFGPVIPLSARGIDLPPDVDSVFQSLLAIEPKKRYPTAAAAAEALDRALARSGIMLTPIALTPPQGTAIRAINLAPSYQSFGILESEVEQILGADLLREPIEKAHARAEALRDPVIVARLLDRWSQEGRFFSFRLRHLGRIANLRDIRSRNVYFYQLDVLLETREQPVMVEEPDSDAQAFPVRRELERWQVKLPPPTTFNDDPGRAEIIGGSERVVQCPRCDGQGHEICPQCKGSRRILQTRTIPAGQPADHDGTIYQQETLNHGSGAAVVVGQQPAATQFEVKQALIPCPTCSGSGALSCTQCQSIGRLVQRKAFTWRREALERRSRDDVPNLDENALREEAEATTVYAERATSLRREWSSVPGIRELVADVERQTSSTTRVVLAEVTVQMIPYTVVQLDLGHEDLVVEGDIATQGRDDAVHSLEIIGFENILHVGAWATDTERRLLWIVFIFGAIILVIYTVYVFFVV